MDLAFIHDLVKNNRYDLSSHAHVERQAEQITIDEIERTLLKGVIIEKYPKDPRGESCLVAANIDNIPLHVVCGMRSKRLLIVTVYKPKMPIWIDYKTRAKEVKSRV